MTRAGTRARMTGEKVAKARARARTKVVRVAKARARAKMVRASGKAARAAKARAKMVRASGRVAKARDAVSIEARCDVSAATRPSCCQRLSPLQAPSQSLYSPAPLAVLPVMSDRHLTDF